MKLIILLLSLISIHASAEEVGCTLFVQTPSREILLESKPMDISQVKDVAGLELEDEGVSASVTFRRSALGSLQASLELYSAGCSSISEQSLSDVPISLTLNCDHIHHSVLKCEIR